MVEEDVESQNYNDGRGGGLTTLYDLTSFRPRGDAPRVRPIWGRNYPRIEYAGLELTELTSEN